ncbi:MAG: class E sortase [Thermoleophilia bacterium]
MVPEDMTLFRAEQRGLVKAGLETERLSRQETVRQASLDFSASLEARAGEPLGRLAIPKIGLEVVMIEDTETADLRKGPGHWPETPVPGAEGNFVVSGHRTTFGAPFFKLNKLESGDEIQVLLPFAVFIYKVSRTLIVLPSETEVVAQRGVEEISLTTCEPIYSAGRRLIVQAELSAFRLVEAGKDALR